MSPIRTFLKKEFTWSRHRLALLVVLFVLVPAVMTTGTLFFEHTLPEHSPIAVVPGNENVTDDDLTLVRGALTFASDPEIVRSGEDAFTRLSREEVYAVVEVPSGLTTPNETATVDVYVDGNITIFRAPSRAIVTLLGPALDDALPSQVDAEHHVMGAETPLSEYLLPTFLMLLVMLVAFVYVPTTLATEEPVFDRLRMKSSLDAVLAAKLLYFMALVVVSILVVYAVGALLGYQLNTLSLSAAGVYLLTFLYLAAISTAIMLVTGFSTLGRVLNVGLFFMLIPGSNLAYPAGFFSPLSKSIARHNPLHYSGILTRSSLLKETGLGLFSDWLGLLVGFTIATLVVLKLAVVYYKQNQ